MLPCDILSGFLVFSDRVAYPAYSSMPRHFGFSVMEDQQCAAALMWTCVTLVYLVPAAIQQPAALATELLPWRLGAAGIVCQHRDTWGSATFGGCLVGWRPNPCLQRSMYLRSRAIASRVRVCCSAIGS
jgi:hypothetical protein